jgi:hypothetical protein
MANLQYGLKEVANVIFFDVETNKPVIFFDTLKVSTIENESESAEARGGQGNNKLLSWDFGRTANLTLQDALLSDNSLAMLAGTEVQTTGVTAVGVEGNDGKLVVETGKITLKETPIEGSVTVFLAPNGIITEEATVGTITGAEVTLTGATDGAKVMAFYEYEAGAGATQVTFSGNDFPSTYRVVGETVSRGRDGKDHKMQFVIPQAKLQSSFSLTMDVENVSVFDFNLEVLVEQGTNKLYDIIRL